MQFLHALNVRNFGLSSKTKCQCDFAARDANQKQLVPVSLRRLDEVCCGRQSKYMNALRQHDACLATFAVFPIYELK
eukprot:6214110-Pleurochrysis_carterae.AAC.7